MLASPCAPNPYQCLDRLVEHVHLLHMLSPITNHHLTALHGVCALQNIPALSASDRAAG